MPWGWIMDRYIGREEWLRRLRVVDGGDNTNTPYSHPLFSGMAAMGSTTATKTGSKRDLRSPLLALCRLVIPCWTARTRGQRPQELSSNLVRPAILPASAACLHHCTQSRHGGQSLIPLKFILALFSSAGSHPFSCHPFFTQFILHSQSIVAAVCFFLLHQSQPLVD